MDNPNTSVDAGADSPDYPLSWKIVSYALGTFCCLEVVCALFFISAVLWSSKSRNNGFNVYLVFLLIPDAIFNASATVAMFYEASNEGVYHNATLCLFRNALAYFHFISNLYLNAVVGHTILVFLRASNRRLRLKPPALKKVFINISLVYVFAILFTLWCAADTPWTLFTAASYQSCVFIMGSSVFHPLVTTFIIVTILGLPMLYIGYVAYTVRRDDLLPADGRTRSIALFFARIVVVFYCFFLPCNVVSIALLLITPDPSGDTARFWLLRAVVLLVMAQAFATLYFCKFKDDLLDAVSQHVLRIKSTRTAWTSTLSIDDQQKDSFTGHRLESSPSSAAEGSALERV